MKQPKADPERENASQSPRTNGSTPGANRSTPVADYVASLHASTGNQFVQRLFRSSRGSSPAVGSSSLDGEPQAVQSAKREEQMGAGYDVRGETADEIRSVQGSGRSLDGELRGDVGGLLDGDVTDVTIHTGALADRLNRRVNAQAFTAGRDIFFRRGTYSPETARGRALLVHELAHVRSGNSGPQASTGADARGEVPRVRRAEERDGESFAIHRLGIDVDPQLDSAMYWNLFQTQLRVELYNWVNSQFFNLGINEFQQNLQSGAEESGNLALDATLKVLGGVPGSVGDVTGLVSAILELSVMVGEELNQGSEVNAIEFIDQMKSRYSDLGDAIGTLDITTGGSAENNGVEEASRADGSEGDRREGRGDEERNGDEGSSGTSSPSRSTLDAERKIRAIEQAIVTRKQEFEGAYRPLRVANRDLIQRDVNTALDALPDGNDIVRAMVTDWVRASQDDWDPDSEAGHVQVNMRYRYPSDVHPHGPLGMFESGPLEVDERGTFTNMTAYIEDVTDPRGTKLNLEDAYGSDTYLHELPFEMRVVISAGAVSLSMAPWQGHGPGADAADPRTLVVVPREDGDGWVHVGPANEWERKMFYDWEQLDDKPTVSDLRPR